jgi:hypothetical protein
MYDFSYLFISRNIAIHLRILFNLRPNSNEPSSLSYLDTFYRGKGEMTLIGGCSSWMDGDDRFGNSHLFIYKYVYTIVDHDTDNEEFEACLIHTYRDPRRLSIDRPDLSYQEKSIGMDPCQNEDHFDGDEDPHHHQNDY